MKKLIFTFLMTSLISLVYGQQDPQYSQFMFNKLALNPAYAGSGETGCISCLYREQWIGIDGAPRTITANFEAPLLARRVGIGLNLIYDQIGISKTTTASMAYVYRLKLGDGYLGIGLQGSLINTRVNWDMTTVVEIGDTEVPTGNPNKVSPNFGAGLYYHSEHYYVGLSIPHFLNNNIDFGDADIPSSTEVISRLDQHYYLMAGVMAKLGTKIKMKPALLIKYEKKSPFDMDLNLSFLFVDRLWAGATYRLGGSSKKGFGESIDVVIQVHITNQIKLGLAYDFTLSEIKDYTDGTLEVMLHYCMNSKKTKLVNPRFF